jgi:hypothetical protein
LLDFFLLFEPLINNKLNLAAEIPPLGFGYPLDLGMNVCIQFYRGRFHLVVRLLLPLCHDNNLAFSASTSACVRE